MDSTALQPTGCAMNDEHTTAVVQRYVDELAGDSPAEPIIRALLDRAVRRLHLLCASMLHRSYDEQKVRYRWLGKQLRGYDKAAPKQLCRSFIETGGLVKTTADRIMVRFDRRSHNPILREGAWTGILCRFRG